MMRRFFVLLLIASLAVSVSACGRKNAPVAPEDVDPDYPRQYPAPVPIPNSKKTR